MKTIRLFSSSLFLVCTFGLCTPAQAYNGQATITKQTEKEHELQMKVTAIEHHGLLKITVTSPMELKTLKLTSFALVQIENGKTVLRVPMRDPVAMHTVHSEGGVIRLENKPLDPEVSFSVAKEKLAITQLEVRYTSSPLGGNGWTYRVDLSSYLDGKNSP